MRKISIRKMVTVSLVFVFILSLLAACAGGGTTSEPPKPANQPSQPANPSSSGKTEAPAPEEDVYPENGLPKKEKVTLKYGFFVGGYGRDVADLAIKTFTEKYPNVTIEITASSDLPTILSTKISANDDNDMFDMFNRKPSGDIVALVEAGKLEPLEDMWERTLPDAPDKKLKDMVFSGVYSGANRINGIMYEIPTVSTYSGLFFNKKLFEEKGWNQNPKTWNEFLDLLEDIKSDGITPMVFPGMYPSYHDNAFGNTKMYELADMKGQFDTFHENFQAYKNEYSSPEAKELWTRVYELGQKGYFYEGMPALNHTQSQMLVIQGQVAMVSTGSHVENEMKDSTPEGFEWGFMAVPFRESTDQNLWVKNSISNGHYIWAAKPELNKAWAKEFIMWQMSMEIQSASAEQGALPVRNDLISDPARADKLYTSHKNILRYLEENKALTIRPNRSVSISDPLFSQATKTFEEAIPKIFIGKQDPQPILEEADKLMVQVLQNLE